MSTRRQRRTHVLDVLKKNRWLFQFGQEQDSLAGDGMWACGHTSVQTIVKIWKDKRVSINEVERLCGTRPDPENDGISNLEIVRALRALDLPYKSVSGVSHREILKMSRDLGPVIFLHLYYMYPKWKGYVYNGTRATVTPNGFARPYGEAGRNQLTGFYGNHWAVLGTSVWRDRRKNFDAFLHDPNHNSSSRPERPPYDIVTEGQFKKLYDTKRLAIVPTRRLNP